MNHGKHGPLHGILMILCCLIPIAALLFFTPQLKNLIPGVNLSYLVILLCPLMHVLMMVFMRDKDSCHGDTKKEEEQN